MPLTLDPTPGGANANTFATLDEYKNYWNARLFNTKQLAATDPQITAALVWAGRLLNKIFLWTGAPATTVQAMTWPRTSMVSVNNVPIDQAVIPQDLKDAQSEWAGQLIVTDLSATNSILQQGISALRAGPVSITYKSGGSTIDMANADILKQQPELAYLSKAVPDAVRLLLAPSWYARATR